MVVALGATASHDAQSLERVAASNTHVASLDEAGLTSLALQIRYVVGCQLAVLAFKRAAQADSLIT